MAFRHQIRLTNEENVGSLTLSCGNFSTTCPITYPDSSEDEGVIPSSAGTGVDVNYSIVVMINDPYQDPELAIYTYEIEFTAAGSPDLSGITIEAPGYQLLKINEEEYEPTLIHKPETLYAWTGILNANNVIVYTETANPTSSDKIYYEDGTEMTGTTYLNTRVNSIVSSDGSTLTIDYTDLRP